MHLVWDIVEVKAVIRVRDVWKIMHDVWPRQIGNHMWPVIEKLSVNHNTNDTGWKTTRAGAILSKVEVHSPTINFSTVFALNEAKTADT